MFGLGLRIGAYFSNPDTLEDVETLVLVLLTVLSILAVAMVIQKLHGKRHG